MLPPATWYPDPSGRHEHRYWDGGRWTEHVADAGIADIDPLNAVTADEQVDGGLAADIAAVAMASTSTVGDDATDHDGGPSDWTEPPRREDSAGADTSSVPADDEGVRDDEGDDDGRDAWAAASSMFVMPPETVASLRSSAAEFWDDLDDRPHDRPDGHHDGADHVEDDDHAGGTSDAPRTPVGLTEITSEEEAQLADARCDGADVLVRLDEQRSAIVRLGSVRAVEGSVRLHDAAPDWARRAGGAGTAVVRGTGAAMLLSVVAAAGLTLTVDSFLAVDQAAALEPLDDVRSGRSLVRVSGAVWLAVDAGGSAAVSPLVDADVIDRRRLIAWTDGVEVIDVGDGRVHLDGHGQLLLRDLGGPLPSA